ncbi:hypothetical protein HPB50_016975 [Hyalomma asiaticum]|uniref:Uncharacterized protein n=1 Tax=Hyalomma asiaticum TaxID=266040 RepID=A0ACB7S9C6_HYAAI|nr:hypothetical protein HPB50_016975 [Hyalomma asiaticum]
MRLKPCDQRAILRKLAKQIALNVFEGLRVECGDSASVDALIKKTAKLTQRRNSNYREVVQRFKEDETLPTVSTTTMQRMLIKLGFRYKKRTRNALLIEATHIVQSHRRYLRQMAELRRQGRAIFFTDETWVNAGHTRSRVWIDGTVQSTYEARRSGLSTGLRNPSGKRKSSKLKKLNPIELVWSDVKGFVAAANNTFKLQDVETLLWQGIKQVTAEKWKRYMEHVIAQEDVMRKLDHVIDDVDTKAAVVITLEDETMSSSDLSCDEDHDI